MGIPQKLIVEAAPPTTPFIERGARQFWKTLEELFGGIAEKGTDKSIEQTIENLERVVGEDNVRILKAISKSTENVANKTAQITNYLATNPTIKKNIERMLEADAAYAEAFKKSTEKFIKDPEVSNYLKDFYKAALERTEGDVEKAKETLKSILDDTFTKKELETFFDEVEIKQTSSGFEINFKNEPIPEDISSIPIDPANATEEGLGAGPGIDTEETIEEIENLSRNKSPFSSIIQSLINKGSFKDLQTILTAYRRAFKKMDLLQAEFNTHAKRMEYKINQGLRYDAEIKKMQDILVTVKKTWNQIPKETYYGWYKTLPEKVKNVLGNTTEATGMEWKIFWKKLLEQKAWDQPIMEELKAYAKLWPFRKPWSKTTPGKWIFKTPQADLKKRIGNLILFRDPRTFSEMKDALMANGVQQDIARNIVSRFAMESVFLPVVIALIEEPFRPVVNWYEQIYNAVTDKDKNWINFNEPDSEGNKIENASEIIKNDFMQNLGSLMPQDLWEWLRNAIDPTFADELWFKVLVPLIKGPTENQKQESKDFLKKKQDDLKRERENLDQETKNIIDSTSKKVDNTIDKIADTELGFKAFLMKEWNMSSLSDYEIKKEGSYWHISKGGDNWYYLWKPDKNTFEQYVD